MKRLTAMAACLALAMGAGGDQDRLVTDRDVRYGGETLDEANVAMSCRMGEWVEEFEHGIFKPDAYAMFRTKNEEVDVLVPRARKAVLGGLSALKPGAEVTVFGKVHWAKGIDPYVVIHDWKKGLSQPYDEKDDRNSIVLDFGGRKTLMEKGKAYTLTTPKGEKVEASWGDK